MPSPLATTCTDSNIDNNDERTTFLQPELHINTIEREYYCAPAASKTDMINQLRESSKKDKEKK